MDSNENLCSQGNLKRKAETGRACELLRLLHGTSCFEVMLNRRMPKGMYGGVRGERKSPLLDLIRGKPLCVTMESLCDVLSVV